MELLNLPPFSSVVPVHPTGARISKRTIIPPYPYPLTRTAFHVALPSVPARGSTTVFPVPRKNSAVAHDIEDGLKFCIRKSWALA